MTIAVKLELKQSNKLYLSQSLRQFIKFLALPNVELAEMINQEILDNPILEEIPSSNSLDEAKVDFQENNYSLEENDNFEVKKWTESSSKNFWEQVPDHPESLNDHLLGQARLIANTESEYDLYANLITSFNSDGFFTQDLEKFTRKNNFKLEEVKKILNKITLFDPVGCGSSGVRESLLVQSNYFYPKDKILNQLISDHFINLQTLNYKKIALEMKINLKKIIEKAKIINDLLPYPGRLYSDQKTKYIVPDLEVQFIDDSIAIRLNDYYLPKIKIEKKYLNQKEILALDSKKESRYIKEKLVKGRNLIQNLENRKKTILKVTEAILEKQADFLLKGPGNLIPLTHSDIASQLGLHESTISRVVNNKYIQTPWGIFPLKYFFVSKIGSTNLINSVDYSSEKIREIIKHTILNEKQYSPLSDDQIATILQKNSIEIARRTVAKYRKILGIPSAKIRKNINYIKQEDKIENYTYR